MAHDHHDHDLTELPRDLRSIAMGASLGVAVLMLVGKLGAYFITGSTAILSDAAESIVHIAATGFAGFSLWYVKRPADREHPYGHGKMAYFSAGFEGALILFAALYIIYEATLALIEGPELQQLTWGIAITGALALVNLALGLFLIRVGKKQNAIILVANGKHVLTDMWTSAAVVVGVTVVYFTGILWIDPVIAIAAAINILFSGGALMYRSFTGLLDRADPLHTQEIVEVLQKGVEENIIGGFHQLRHRESNDAVWIEVHMLLPSDMPVREAHRRVTEVEERIDNAVGAHNTIITSHIEPLDHQSAHPHGHVGDKDILTP